MRHGPVIDRRLPSGLFRLNCPCHRDSHGTDPCWKVENERREAFYHHFTAIHFPLSTLLVGRVSSSSWKPLGWKVGALRTLHRFLDGKFQSIAWVKRRAGPWKPQTGNYGRVVRIRALYSRFTGFALDRGHEGAASVDPPAEWSWQSL